MGRCYCGAVAYEILGAFEYALVCHCTDCQRVTGSAFKPFAAVATDRLRVIEGEEAIERMGDATGHNAFCRLCGSLLFSMVRGGSHYHVTLGTIEGARAPTPSAHIFVRSKAPWHTIADGLPQHEALP